MNVIIVFKTQATAEVFDMLRVDNIDMGLVAKAFHYLLQAAFIVVTLIRFEGAVRTSTKVYNLFKISRFNTASQSVTIGLRCSLRNVRSNTSYTM